MKYIPFYWLTELYHQRYMEPCSSATCWPTLPAPSPRWLPNFSLVMTLSKIWSCTWFQSLQTSLYSALHVSLILRWASSSAWNPTHGFWISTPFLSFFSFWKRLLLNRSHAVCCMDYGHGPLYLPWRESVVLFWHSYSYFYNTSSPSYPPSINFFTCVHSDTALKGTPVGLQVRVRVSWHAVVTSPSNERLQRWLSNERNVTEPMIAWTRKRTKERTDVLLYYDQFSSPADCFGFAETLKHFLNETIRRVHHLVPWLPSVQSLPETLTNNELGPSLSAALRCGIGGNPL